jgi:hypothetical protein
MSMYRISLMSVALACALVAKGVAAQGQPKPRDCPVGVVDTSAWMLTRDRGVGIEIKHPADYRAKHWESRSDTSGVTIAFWRNAASRIEFHELGGFWSTQGPKLSVPPCRLEMRSATLALHLERTVRTLWDGRDTLYFVAKGIFTPAGKPRVLVELGAPDSTGLLEQIAILRTIRFLKDR